MSNDEKHNKCPYYEEKCKDLQCFCPKYKAYLDVQDSSIVEQELRLLNITDDMDKFEKMLTTQTHFASRFHSVKNVDKDLTDKWNKEYCICIEDEIEELFDYIRLPFNHDLTYTSAKEMKKEVVDIVHFVMNVFISGNFTVDKLYDIYFKKRNPNISSVKDKFKFVFEESIKEIERKFTVRRNFVNNEYTIVPEDYRDSDTLYDERILWCQPDESEIISKEKWNDIILQLALELLFVNRKIRQQISWKHWKKPNDEINYTALYDAYEELFYRFILLAAFLFRNEDELCDTYIKKNIENIRRQRHGY